MARLVGSLLLAYEIFALWGPAPTYSTIAGRLPAIVSSMILGAFTSYLWWHIMVESRGLDR